MFRIGLILLLLITGCHAAGSGTTRSGAGYSKILTATKLPENTAPDQGIVTAAFDAPESAELGSTNKTETIQASLDVPVSVNEPAESPHPLTLASLEQIALGYNPTIPQAGALVRQQEGLTIQAGLYPNPQAGYLRNDADQSGQSQTSGVFLSQEFVTAGKLSLAQQASQQDVELRSEQLNAQQQRVINDLRIRFYEILGAQESVAAARELELSAADGTQIAKELIDARQVGRPDLLQAEMQLSLARGALKDAEIRLQAGRRQLANLAGIPILPDGDLIGDLNDQIPELVWETRLQQLLECSPLLKSQAAELQAAQAEVRMAHAQAVPNVSVQVVAQRDHVLKYSSVSTLVALPVPFFNRNQGGIIHAEAFLVQQQKEYERLRWALSDQLASSFRQYSSLQSESARIEKELLPLAKENLELTSEAYRQGRMDFLRVVDARKTYFQSRMSQIETLTELHKVIVEIEGLQLTGGLNPTEVGTALQTTSGMSGGGARSTLLQQLDSQRNNSNRNLPGAIQAGDR
jgi:cobalt-zinc-cadmium efflux system outer membrane protein